MAKDKADVLQLGDPQPARTPNGRHHGTDPRFRWGIAKRIEQVSEDLLELKYGSLYPALMKLEQNGWIESEWGTSENNRRARFYLITKQGKKQLAVEAENWEQMATFIARMLHGAR